jgi:hypothetical protein
MENVKDVKVIGSSHQGFERSAIKAAQKLKYKSKVVDGCCSRSKRCNKYS